MFVSFKKPQLYIGAILSIQPLVELTLYYDIHTKYPKYAKGITVVFIN
jgi:hypothetical protein